MKGILIQSSEGPECSKQRGDEQESARDTEIDRGERKVRVQKVKEAKTKREKKEIGCLTSKQTVIQFGESGENC